MENTIKVPIHDSKKSKKVVRFLDLNDFNYAFQDAYNNGEIWGAYYTKTGKVYATVTGGETLKNCTK